jgi:glycosyltransferase involved in cell wall biosynthesis
LGSGGSTIYLFFAELISIYDYNYLLLRNIVIDCERMKYPYTGLHEYCLRLSKAIFQLKENINADLFFYTPKNEIDFLGNNASYIKQKSFHKFYNPHTKQASIWHTTYQGSMYFPKTKKTKKVLTIHDLNFLYDIQKSQKKKKKYLDLLQKKIDQASYITAISNFTLQEIRKHLKTDNIPVRVIYNGCDCLTDYKQTQPETINTKTPFLFTIGTIARKKNFHVLPALLVGNDFRLIIAGIIQEKEYYDHILSEAQKHNVSERVIFTGPITNAEKYWYYNHAAMFLFPSLSEGFGIPVVEAMSQGTPVLTSTFTALPEIAGDSGYYFNSFEPDDMQSVLMQSLNDFNSNPIKKYHLIERSKKFNWQDAAFQYIDIYNSLL